MKKPIPVSKLVAELIAIDPTLAQHKSQLQTLLKDFIAANPNPRIDAQFAASLREQLISYSSSHMNPKQNTSHRTWLLPSLTFAGGLLLAALVVMPMTDQPTVLVPSDTVAPMAKIAARPEQDPTVSMINIIQNTEQNAFGTLNQNGNETNDENTEDAVINTELKATRPQSGGGFGGGGEMANPALDSYMIYPPYGDNINYEYEIPADLPQIADTYNVYKKFDQKKDAPQLNQLIQSLGFPEFNMQSFDDLRIQSLGMTQDKKYGYQVNVDFNSGDVFINQNWDQWPQPYNDCNTPKCYEDLQIKVKDLPSDAKLIKIVQDFAKTHGIDLSQTDKPYIEKHWEDYVFYEQEETVADISNRIIGDTIGVVFPLIIDGQRVVNQWDAKPQGIRFDVSIRENKVSHANLPSWSYQSSAYSAPAADNVKRFISTGGLNGRQVNYPEKTITLGLSDPQIQLIEHYQYKDGKQNKFLIPALIMKVQEPAKDNTKDEATNAQMLRGYVQNRMVIVPLIDNFVDFR